MTCEKNIKRVFEENPNIVDKEIIAKMKELKDKKGRRLYKTSTITSRLCQFRLKQQTPSELPAIEKTDEDISIDASKSDAPELKNVNLEGAKKEVEEAFGRRNEMNDKIKSVEPQETKSGNVIYDGRKRTETLNKETITEKEVDNLVTNGTNKKVEEAVVSDLALKEITSYLERLERKLEKVDKEILQLKQESMPVDELVDVQLRESIINMLDELKVDDSEDFSETIKSLIEQEDKVKEVSPSFLEKISLDKDGSAHGKLFMHNDKWKFLKRARPIIYGIVGASVGCISLFILLVLLEALEVLPGWI